MGSSLHAASFARIPWRADLGEGDSPLRRLTLAYFGWAVPLLATGRVEDLDHVDVALTSLESVPWSAPGIFRDLWNPYTVSHRVINLLAGLHLYREAGGSLDTPAAGRLLDHLRFGAAFIAADPERDLQANHLLKNWTALAAFAAAAPDPASVFPYLSRAAAASLTQLVLDDGGHAERSPMYHALGLLDLEILQASGAMPDLGPRLDRSIGTMRDALSVLTHPDGDVALFNDAWLGGAPSSRSLGVGSPMSGPRSLPETGYVRLAESEDAVIFDCGPCGLDLQPGHAHADFLSFELTVAGSRFIVDPGTPTYSAGPLRERCRSASTHNGPWLEGLEPLELWKSFRVGRRAAAGGLTGDGLAQAPLWCAGWHAGYSQHGTEARRWIGLWPGRALLVVDGWIGNTATSRRSRFTIPRPWTLRAGLQPPAFEGPRLVRCQALAGRIAPTEASVWWPRYGTEEPATILDIRPAVDEGISLSALLWSWGDPSVIPGPAVNALGHALIGARRTAPEGFRA
jgi:hypothetical protein